MSSGIIAEGEVVTEGQAIISMPDTAAMVAEISVHETEVDKVRPGQPATIVMDAFPDRILQGEVLEVAPLPDQQRGWLNPDLKVYETLVRINGTHDFLKSRMSCKVKILVRQLDDILIVPIQVVSNRKGRKVCYVMTSQGPQEREVQTGEFNDTFVQIVNGLDEGDDVLLNPPHITETSATADEFEGVQPLPQESDASNNIDSDGMRPRLPSGDQTRRGAERSGVERRGGSMPGIEGLTEEQKKQLKELGEKMRSGEGLTEEEKKKFQEQFRSRGGRRGKPENSSNQ
jgi:hypothetical protein